MPSEKEKAAERYEKRTFPEGWTIRKAFLAGWNERDKKKCLNCGAIVREIPKVTR